MGRPKKNVEEVENIVENIPEDEGAEKKVTRKPKEQTNTQLTARTATNWRAGAPGSARQGLYLPRGGLFPFRE